MSYEPQIIFEVQTVPKGSVLRVPMVPRSPDSPVGFTVLRVFESGLLPIVGCLETEEGKCEGPSLRLLGSVATRQSMLENPDSIIEGQIIGGYRIVTEIPDSSSIYLLPGKVLNEMPKVLKSKSRNRY